jgi:primosomal protein N'
MKLYQNQLQALKFLLKSWSNDPETLVGEILDEVATVQTTVAKLKEEIENLKETIECMEEEAKQANEHIDLIEDHVDYLSCRIDDVLPQHLMPKGSRRNVSRDGEYPGYEMSFQQVGVINYLMGKKVIPQNNLDNLVKILRDWNPWAFEASTRAKNAWAAQAITKLESFPDK